jgi:GNAT superfamily N-acetyltransferase
MLLLNRRKLANLLRKENSLVERVICMEGRLSTIDLALNNLYAIISKEPGAAIAQVKHNVVMLHIFTRRQAGGRIEIRLYSETVSVDPLGELLLVKAADRLVIERINVVKRFQGQGLGRRLLRAAEIIAETEGATLAGHLPCSLLVAHPLRYFFRHCGYEGLWEQGVLILERKAERSVATMAMKRRTG